MTRRPPRSTRFPATPLCRSPASPEPPAAGHTPVSLVPSAQGRQVHAVEHAAAVLFEGPQDERRAHAVGHPGLDDYGRLEEAAHQVATARQQGVGGPATVERVLMVDAL